MSELAPSTPEQPSLPLPEANQLDTFLVTQQYTAGATKEDFMAMGVDPDEVTKYIRGLPDDQREYYKDQRNEAAFNRDAKTTLQAAEPELFQGRVRADLEAAIHGAGYDQYAVGFVQLDAIGELSEAVAHLDEQGGVEMAGYGPNQRFLLHDSEHPMDDYPMGYYTPKMGRFVYAFPVEATSGETPRDSVATGSGMPKDTFIHNNQGETVANSKYCAGFIDDKQVFRANPRFMKEKAVSNAEFESGVQLKVRQLREQAEAEGRGLNTEEETAIRGLAKAVQNRRATVAAGVTEESAPDKQPDTESEAAAFLRENNIDVAAVGSQYEAQVQQFVRGLHEFAAKEGRNLTTQEVQQIRLAAETVQDFRRTAPHQSAA